MQKKSTSFYYFYSEEKIRIPTLLIDIHTHQPNSVGHLSIYNVPNTLEIPSGTNLVSIGLHPWYIASESLIQKFQSLEKLAADPRVLFIGECGLDKVCDTDFELQIRAFELQIDLANRSKKPLMIHCVRAHNEVIHLLTESKNKMPIVFHGFNKNKQIADRILRHGHYLSFGADLKKDLVSSTFSKLPLDRIFLESDDKETDIGTLYKLAAELLNISPEQLEPQITINLRTILGPEFKGV
ncbi:MAG: TatD family hydrolase [Flavobacteriales bacterium]